jgi:hypothetical protein
MTSFDLKHKNSYKFPALVKEEKKKTKVLFCIYLKVMWEKLPKDKFLKSNFSLECLLSSCSLGKMLSARTKARVSVHV